MNPVNLNSLVVNLDYVDNPLRVYLVFFQGRVKNNPAFFM